VRASVARRVLERAETEEGFQAKVVDLAGRQGWLVHAERQARTDRGWRTAIQGDAGWPDLVLLRDGVMLVVELKSESGKVRPEQQAWLAELAMVPGLVVRTWRPSDWPEVESALLRTHPRRRH
jgi:VRR-NUC domain-containing protein